MKQKVKDFVLLVKHDRKWQILIIGLVFLTLWSLIADSGKKRRYVRKAPKIESGATKADESNNELLNYYRAQKKALETRIKKQEEESKVMQTKVKDYEERTAEIFRKLIERTRGLEDQVQSLEKYKNTPVYEEALNKDQLEVFGDLEKDAEVAPPIQPENSKVAFIAAGDSVGVQLIAGANAPTDGSPYPVIFELSTDVYGPDGSALPLGNARLVAAAQGSLVDHRALFRLKSLSMRYPDGSKKVVNVDGWIVGEDGVRGMEGVLIDPIGRILAGELVSGTIQGFGNAYASNGINTTVGGGIVTQENTGDSLEQGFGAGVSSAAGNWSSYIKERASLLVPHVKVLSGRQATAVFSQNVRLDGLIESLEEPNLTFVSLD